MGKLNIDSLRNAIGNQLLRLVYGLNMAIFKKNLSIQKRCFLLIDFEIRAAESSLLQLGEIEEEDDIVEYVSRHFTERPQVENLAAAAHRNSETVAKLIEKCSSSEKFNHALALYFLSLAYTSSVLKKEEDKNAFLERAKQFDSLATEFKADDVFKKYAEVNHRIKYLRKDLAERSAIKFNVTSVHISSFLAVAPALMLVVGVVYTNTLLAHFGVSASLFFSIGDYLATSVEQLQSVAISVGLSIVTFVTGVRETSLRSRMELNELAKRNKIPYLLFVVVLAAAVGQIFSAYHGIHEPGTLLFLTCFLSSVFARYVASRYLKNSFQGEVFLVAVLVFVSYSAVKFLGEIDHIESGKWEGREGIVIITKKDSDINVDNFVIVRANSSYVFAVNKSTNQFKIIPKDQVSEFVVSQIPSMLVRKNL